MFEKSSFFIFMSQLLSRDKKHKSGDILLKRHKLGNIVAPLLAKGLSRIGQMMILTSGLLKLSAEYMTRFAGALQ
jgi:hypothetical protein